MGCLRRLYHGHPRQRRITRDQHICLSKSHAWCQNKSPLCPTFVPNPAWQFVRSRARGPELAHLRACEAAVSNFRSRHALLQVIRCCVPGGRPARGRMSVGARCVHIRSRPPPPPLTCFCAAGPHPLHLRWCVAASPPSQPLSRCCGPGLCQPSSLCVRPLPPTSGPAPHLKHRVPNMYCNVLAHGSQWICKRRTFVLLPWEPPWACRIERQ